MDGPLENLDSKIEVNVQYKQTCLKAIREGSMFFCITHAFVYSRLTSQICITNHYGECWHVVRLILKNDRKKCRNVGRTNQYSIYARFIYKVIYRFMTPTTRALSDSNTKTPLADADMPTCQERLIQQLYTHASQVQSTPNHPFQNASKQCTKGARNITRFTPLSVEIWS